jgi:monovalent cation:H+ antiporter-2, CPA2 family
MEFLKLLEIIFIASAVVVFLLHKFKIPSLVGFLVAGVIIGPHGIGIVEDTQAIEILAEIGVILLLFTIGIEFSMAKLLRMKKAVVAGGGVQVFLTIALSAVAAYLATGDTNRSLFFGFLVALSSTAIVLKMLSERGETDSPHGRVMVGILIFQDLCVVPLMLLVPSLSGEGINMLDVLIKMGKAVLIIVVVLFSARWFVPQLLHQVVRTKSRDLFITTIILLCLGIAFITARFGLSLALGAFLAGLIISESEYSHQATSDILPFKESFIGMFFVSVGMLLDTGYLADNAVKVTIAVALIFGLKVITGLISARVAGSHLRTAIHAGLGLAQIGEFSFVLAGAGRLAGVITGEFYQVFLSSSVITMIMTPFILRSAPAVSEWIVTRSLTRRLFRPGEVYEAEGHPRKRHDHVIIIGFGLNGRNLAKVLKEASIPYVVLEMNSDTVIMMKKKGEPIFYGDGTSSEILQRLSIRKAKLLVVAISDPASTRRIVSVARHENPDLYIIVRTRYFIEIEDLRDLGANEVIPEEFETSIEIFSRVLYQYHFPQGVISEMTDKIRSGSYRALRSAEIPRKHLFDKCEWLPEIELDGFKVRPDSFLIGKNIAQLQVRKKTGVTIIAVRRDSEVFTNPEPRFFFEAGDMVLFTGDQESMNKALQYFNSRESLTEEVT